MLPELQVLAAKVPRGNKEQFCIMYKHKVVMLSANETHNVYNKKLTKHDSKHTLTPQTH